MNVVLAEVNPMRAVSLGSTDPVANQGMRCRCGHRVDLTGTKDDPPRDCHCPCHRPVPARPRLGVDRLITDLRILADLSHRWAARNWCDLPDATVLDVAAQHIAHAVDALIQMEPDDLRIFRQWVASFN
jgi:hypothetical protein